jgi:hypothetical protein
MTYGKHKELNDNFVLCVCAWTTLCRCSENYQIKVITALFFGFVGAWGGAGNGPFTITFSDAARLVRKCVEAPLSVLPLHFNTFFATAPQPHGAETIVL